MGFSLFGSSGDNKTYATTNTTVTDASATAAEGATSLAGGSQLTINSVDSEITGQALGFGARALDANVAVAGQALGSNVLIAGQALDTGLESLRVSANLVPDLLQAQGSQTDAVLRAAQQNVNLAEQFASQGAALARGAQTGGASTLLEGPIPYIAGAILLGLAFFMFRARKA